MEELHLALAEGLIHEDEVAELIEQASGEGSSPLALLRQKGRISETQEKRLMAMLARDGEDRAAGKAGKEAKPLGGRDATTAWTQRGSGTVTADAEELAGLDLDWDRYQFVKFLGQGGMGRVYLAYDPMLRRNVALKFVLHNDPLLAQRFIVEARAQARVNHDGVCKVFEVGELGGKTYIAMQFIDGRPVHEIAGELTTEEKVLVMRDAAEGVHAAHRAGLIHRDLKPANIMVVRGERGRLKTYVMDFGLARVWGEGATLTGMALGTPQYMAPEQARGELSKLDRRTDVYGLGGALYYLLTGKPPIAGTNHLEILSNVVLSEPEAPRRHIPDLPIDLEAIALKCLEKERPARYDSARALAEDLTRYLDGEPVLARPVGTWQRWGRWIRRNKTLAATAAAALILVAISLGWAIHTRRQAALRESLARTFAERVESIERQARLMYLTPRHDIRPERAVLRAQMEEIQAQMTAIGPLAEPSGHYALGRGYLTLGDLALAREHLELARRDGVRHPGAAFALALVLGQLYRAELRENERIADRLQRESDRKGLDREYRDPALELIRQSASQGQTFPEYGAALLAFFEGRLDDALENLERAGSTGSWFYETHKLRGDIFHGKAIEARGRGDREGAMAAFESARSAYTDAADIGRSDPEVYLALAQLHYTMMNLAIYGPGGVEEPYQNGLTALAQALETQPGHFEATVLQSRFFRRLAEDRMTSGQDPSEWLTKADEAATRAYALRPERPEARLKLGLLYYQWANFQNGLGQDPTAYLDKAIAVFDDVPPPQRGGEYFNNLGLVFRIRAEYWSRIGREALPTWDEAIASFQRAIALEPEMTSALTNLGNAAFSRAQRNRGADQDRDLELGIAALEKARALNPNHFVTHYNLGRIYQQRSKRQRFSGRDPEESLAHALACFENGVEIRPKNPHLHNGIGNVYLDRAKSAWEQGRDPFPALDQARVAYEKAVELSPNHGFAHNNIGEVESLRAIFAMAMGKDPGSSLAQSRQALERALSLLPNYAEIWANLARTQQLRAMAGLVSGEDPRPHLKRAEAELEKTFAINPNLAAAWRIAGDVHLLKAQLAGESEGAIDKALSDALECFNRALSAEEPDPVYARSRAQVCLHLARRRQEQGRDGAEFLVDGLTTVAAILGKNADDAEGLAIRAGLLQIRAQAEPPAEQAETRVHAAADLERALRLNPNLSYRWGNPAPSP